MFKEALIMVDVQNDFCPGGALAVKEGDQVVAPLNKIATAAREMGMQIIATRDWHPENTSHFDIWPKHCVQNTEGAKFHPGLNLEDAIIVSKGMGETEDAYSGFDAKNKEGNFLEDILKARGVERLYIGGLATDYCVKATVLDALKKKFRVAVVFDACRAVNIHPGSGQNAMVEMHLAGAEIVGSKDVIEEIANEN